MKPPIQLKKQSILSHPSVLNEIRGICQESPEKPTGPYGIPIVVADWLEPDEYFMGSSKLVEAIMRIADNYGPEMAKELLRKLIPPQDPETP